MGEESTKELWCLQALLSLESVVLISVLLALNPNLLSLVPPHMSLALLKLLFLCGVQSE